MTREKCKEVLQALWKYKDCGYSENEIRESLDMAIKALEQEPCEDAVSRKTVLNTLNRMDSVLDEDRTVETYKELLIACYNDLPPVKPVACIAKVNFSKEDMQELVNEKMKDIVVERKKGKWIPCSERLPEEGTYLVTLKRLSGELIVDMMSFAKDLHKVDEFDFPNKHKSGWYDYDNEYGYWECTTVIAWMELPDPWIRIGG